MGKQVKQIKLGEVLNLRREPFQLPKRDNRGNVQWKDKQQGRMCRECNRPSEMETVETTDLRDLIEEIVMFRLSREKYADNALAARVANTYRELVKSRGANDGHLELSAEAYKFVDDMLHDGDISQQFMANIVPIQEAFAEFSYTKETGKTESP